MKREDLDYNAAEFAPEEDNVFGRIAGRYDRLCDIFSFGIHRQWKSKMARAMAREQASFILDVASGTGDIPLRYLRQKKRNPDARLLVSDICPEMLEVAQGKLEGKDDGLRFKVLNAYDMASIEDNSVDLYSISFAMKICDRELVLKEAFRVLKPGGTFFCLEASQIPIRFIHNAYLAYMDWCMPIIGRLAAEGDASAYQYLLKGVHDFPNQRELAEEIRRYGFMDVSFESLTFGITALHRAVKPPFAGVGTP
ncbi:MAG: ubiquinone/menaquinone biosynthesis methyltransferase [Alphaproteobacteria bacterium]|nr:ubiquinone/menaquinone biosynthesis methyltransferase [Alphaproteobacteria bacterium]